MAGSQATTAKGPRMPKIFGDAKAALKVYDEYELMYFSDEIQTMFDEDLDYSDPNVVAKSVEMQRIVTMKTLESLGLDHFKQHFEGSNLPTLPSVLFQAYGDCPEACVVGGSLASIVRDYRNQVDFLAVYLAEAHAENGWSLGSRVSSMKQHKSLQERIMAARDLLKLDSETHDCMTDNTTDTSKIRLVVDQMDSIFSRKFGAFPDRIIFIQGGKVTYTGNTVIEHIQNPMHLMTHEARDWLEKNVGPAI